MRIVIVGGGSSGWITASWLNKFVPNSEIVVVESPNVSRIGVGESVTVHIREFLRVLEIDENEFLFETGSIRKYGNNFINWTKNQGEVETFAFYWNKNRQQLLRSMYNGITWNDNLNVKADDTRLTDYWLALFDKGLVDRSFTKTWTAWNHFIEPNKSPHINGEPFLPTNDLSWSYHINTERFADYLRDTIAVPNGVSNIRAHIKQVVKDSSNSNKISKLILDNDEEITGDLYIDSSGFHRVLIKEFDSVKWRWHNDCPNDSAIVCQQDYVDPHKEMSCFTKTIAMDYGWSFDVTLYHRRGTGYVFSNDYITDDQARAEFSKYLIAPKFEPKKLKWDKKSIQEPGFGNVCAIGMTAGFIEPMEANMLGLSINSTWELTNTLKAHDFQATNINWSTFNQRINSSYDDTADFILAHYTLSPRQDTEFWRNMHDLGIKKKHREMILDKYLDPNSTTAAAANSNNLYPDFLWLELAAAWDVDLSKWPRKSIDEEELVLAKAHFDYLNLNTKVASKYFMNNYDYLRKYVFKDMTSKEWTTEVFETSARLIVK